MTARNAWEPRGRVGQGRVASRANSTSRGASMACGLVAAPTWTGIWTKWNQQVRALGPAVGAATVPADSRPIRATARAVQRDASMTWAHPSADAASGREAKANGARFPSGPFRTTQG